MCVSNFPDEERRIDDNDCKIILAIAQMTFRMANGLRRSNLLQNMNKRAELRFGCHLPVAVG